MTHVAGQRSEYATPRATAATTTSIRVLIAEDEANLGTILEQFMTARGFAVTMVRNGGEALARLRSEPFDVALLDVVMPDVDGLEVLRQLRATPLPPEIIIITGNSGIETAMAAMKLGAYDFLSKPYRMAEIEALVRRAFEKRLLQRTNRALRKRLARAETEPTFETRYAPLRAVLSLVDQAAASESAVLIQGENGTGKRALARHIHARGPRAHEPFVDIDCTQSHNDFLEALFGARRDHDSALAGAVDVAASGTLYLHDVANLSRESQKWLAHALEHSVVSPANGSREIPWNACVIAATARPVSALESAIDATLLHRLTSTRIELPPLRLRTVDLHLLAERLLRKLAPNRSVQLSDDALAALEAYPWPGNISELKAVLERALLRTDASVIDTRALALVPGAGESHTPRESRRLDDLEREHIAAVLESTRWHQGKAAEVLGISPKTLYRKIREYGFRRPGGRTT